MKLNIQWPELQSLETHGDDEEHSERYGWNSAIIMCKQAVEKAIEDAEKEINRQKYIKDGEEKLSKHGAVIESGIAQAFLNASLHNYKDGDKCATPKD